MPWFRRATAIRRTQDRYVAPATGDTFLVSGVTYRQDALRRAGVRAHLFRLVCEPENPVDPYAVAVYCGPQHIGYVSAKISMRYAEAVRRVEQTGATLLVHGAIENGNPGFRAKIDCPWPEDIGQ